MPANNTQAAAATSVRNQVERVLQGGQFDVGCGDKVVHSVLEALDITNLLDLLADIYSIVNLNLPVLSEVRYDPFSANNFCSNAIYELS